MDEVRALGLLVGVAADAAVGDPPRGHPVAAFGRLAARLERVGYADRRSAGLVHVAALVGLAALTGSAIHRAGRTSTPMRLVSTAAATGVTLGGASLAWHGLAMARALEAHDLVTARALLPALCGRDPDVLDAAGLTRAGVESIAENTSDAVVAPLLWGMLAGIPGMLAYRAVNTLDAMIGYRSARYRRFGWSAARLDDVANLLPARLTAVLTALCSPAVSGSVRQSFRMARRDGAAHPSPNAGCVEAAFAGALGVRLGGHTPYARGVEQRPLLGTGRAPDPRDLRRAVRLSRLVTASAAGVLATGCILAGRLGPRGGH